MTLGNLVQNFLMSLNYQICEAQITGPCTQKSSVVGVAYDDDDDDVFTWPLHEIIQVSKG